MLERDVMIRLDQVNIQNIVDYREVFEQIDEQEAVVQAEQWKDVIQGITPPPVPNKDNFQNNPDRPWIPVELE